MQNPTSFIRANLPVEPVPGIPEIRLHKAVPSSGLHRLARRDMTGFESPYWAYHWAGGLALARHVLDNPDIVVGRRVLDLGAGSGLVAIAAAKAKAADVIAAEIDPYAVAALRLNAAENDVAVALLHADLTAPEAALPPVDLVLVGDLFYEAGLAARVSALLDRCLAAGMEVLVGDPWRSPLPVARLSLLARYEVIETGHKRIDSGVFAFTLAKA
jgi:predicted nicotinamide N-methyase